MCGIIGVTGNKPVSGKIISSLKSLEYRGYDSSGIALADRGEILLYKTSGRISVLEKILPDGLSAEAGIGHTRWATHGKVSKENAHPFESRDFALVHNGIIENYSELKAELESGGTVFSSQTDSEVIVHLLQKYYENNNAINAFKKTCARLKGSYAIAALHRESKKIYCTRVKSPLIIGICDEETLAASDIAAIKNPNARAVYLNDYESAVISQSGAEFYDKDFNKTEKEAENIERESTQTSLGTFSHYMQKEIYEQPQALAKTICEYSPCGSIDFERALKGENILSGVCAIYLVGCGSAYHAALCAKYTFEKQTHIACIAEYAGEFRYSNCALSKNSLVILISQSGETADTLAALQKAKSANAKTLSIVNVSHSSIAKQSDFTLFTRCGPEISVATTKAFTSQLALLSMLGAFLSKQNGICGEKEFLQISAEIKLLPEKALKTINKNSDKMKSLAESFKNTQSFFYIGRGTDSACALEGSLKIKEISYVNSVGMPASELKHGTISLIDENSVCIGLFGESRLCAKTLSSLNEVKARGARIIAFAPENLKEALSECEELFLFPDCSQETNAVCESIMLQLVAYNYAKMKNMPIDKPRNLAKSVTVE